MQRPVQITRLRKSEYHELIRELDRRKKVLEPQLPLKKLTKYVAENLATPVGDPIPECVTCGVCCNFALMVPVTLKDSDKLHEYLSIAADNWESEIEIDRALPRDPANGNCVHLAGTLGETIGCTIYEDRPIVCHDFEAGSDRCREYRRMYGIEPQLGESQAAAAIERLETRVTTPKIEDMAIVPASKIMRASYGPEGVTYSESTLMKIFIFLDDETPHEIYEFDSEREVWFENDLVGYSMDEAKAMIAARSAE